MVADIDMCKFFDKVNYDKLLYFMDRQFKHKLVSRVTTNSLILGEVASWITTYFNQVRKVLRTEVHYYQISVYTK